MSIKTSVTPSADHQKVAAPMTLPGQIKQDFPESGVVLTSYGYRDRDRTPEFRPVSLIK
jgi:hypothetical protein